MRVRAQAPTVQARTSAWSWSPSPFTTIKLAALPQQAPLRHRRGPAHVPLDRRVTGRPREAVITSVLRQRAGPQHHRRLQFLRSTAPASISRGSQMDETPNHYVKMPALAPWRPGIEGTYYVDLDAVTPYPWTVDPLFASEHTNQNSDVSFKYGFVRADSSDSTVESPGAASRS